MKKATIKDLAREAGVSVATASNTWNNPGIVRKETRELVLMAAKKLSYTPNANGKRLRTMETKIIGFFVSSMSGEYYGALADSMQTVCQCHGYELHICIIQDTHSIVQKLQDRSVDAAVIFHHGVDTELRSYIRQTECPVVFLDVEEQGEHVSSILYESRRHGGMAAEYLLGLGKKRLMHVSGIPGGYDSEMRQLGFLQTLETHGINKGQVKILPGLLNRTTAYQEMRRYLHEGNPVPEAIFAANDLSAIGCMQALSEVGFRVPEEVSILGCDDSSLCEFVTPTLTTIRTNFRVMGTRAAEEALRLIDGREGRILKQDGTIVIRHSCQITQ